MVPYSTADDVILKAPKNYVLMTVFLNSWIKSQNTNIASYDVG